MSSSTDRRDDRSRDDQGPSIRRWHPAEWLLLVLAPPAAWIAFGIVLINQDFFIDPWYYVGYGRAFTLMHELFGWRYYVVRFPVMMLNEMALSGAYPFVGYAVLRYILVLGCGIPLYAWARRRFGRTSALLAYLFLFCNPLLPRVILWDLTTFVSVPMALAAIGVWLLSDRPLARMASGALMMASVASHAFTGTALATFLAVVLVQRLRTRKFRALVRRDILATGAGSALCFAAGCLYYYWRIGPFDPTLIVTVTRDAARLGHEYAGTHATPFSVWAAREYHIYVPVICVAMAGGLLGRRLRQPTAEATVWWFGAAYTVVYLTYQFVFGRFVLETFYYFAHLTLVVFPLVPVVVGELTAGGRVRARPWLAGVAGTAALLLPALVHRLAPDLGPWMDDFGYSNVVLLVVLCAAAALIVAAGWRVARRPVAGAAVVCAFLLLVQVFTLLSPIHRRVFDSRHRAREEGVYLAALQMLDVFVAASRPDARVIPWHCPTQYSVGSIVSTLLLYSLSDPWHTGPCEVRIGEFERTQLSVGPEYVLMLNENPEPIDALEAALREEGYRVDRRVDMIIGNEAYRARLRLAEIAKQDEVSLR